MTKENTFLSLYNNKKNIYWRGLVLLVQPVYYYVVYVFLIISKKDYVTKRIRVRIPVDMCIIIMFCNKTKYIIMNTLTEYKIARHSTSLLSVYSYSSVTNCR